MVGLGGAIAGSARVILSADTRQLHSGLRRGERDFDSTARRMRASAAQIAKTGALIGGALAVGFGKQAISAASDLQEQMARVGEVFDNSAASVIAWSQTTATSMGLARNEALAFAGTFGLLFRNMGQSPAEAEKLSKSLVQLASDLASFSNVPVEDALAALRSGLTGEIEPLRRFGVFLSEARTKQQAFADTGKKSAAELTTSEKVLTRYKLIMQDTARAQGDFERTSGGFANQQRILKAQFANASAELGTKLLPLVTRLVTYLNKEGIPAARKLGDRLQTLGRHFQTVADHIGGTKRVLLLLIGVAATWKAAALIRALTNIGVAAGPAGAAGKVGKLETRLLGLNALTLAPIVIPITYAVTTKILDATGGTGLLKAHGGRVQDTLAKFGLGQEEQAAMSPKELRERVAELLSGKRQRAVNEAYRTPGSRADQLPSQRLSDVTLQPAAKDAKPPKSIKFSLDRFRLAEARARTEQQELDVLKDEQAFIRSRIRARRYRGEQLLLAEEALKQVEAQIDGIIEGRKDAKEKAAEARHRAAEDRADKRAAAAKERADTARRKEEARIKEDIRYRSAVGDRLRAFNKRARQKAAHEEVAVALGPLQQQAFINELSGILGQQASNVSPTAGGPLTGAGKGLTIIQHLKPNTTPFAAMREARLAAAHIL